MRTLSILLGTCVAAIPSAEAQVSRHVPSTGRPPFILESAVMPAGADTIYLSGQVADPIDPAKAGRSDLGVTDFGDTEMQTISVLDKVKAALGARGYAMSDIVKITVFLVADPANPGRMDFAGFNRSYRRYFGTKDNPNLVARSTLQVTGLAEPGYLVEIEAIAAKAK